MKDDTDHQNSRIRDTAVDPIDLVSELINTIDKLTNTVAMQKELIQGLRDEIAILKGQKPKPKIPPSQLEGSKAKNQQEGDNPTGKPKKPGQPKGKPRKKKTLLEIHDKPIIQPINIPEGAIFKGFKHYTVQDIVFKPYNTQYLLARWKLPDGSYISGELPKDVHGHYGPELVSYILHQAYACRVTEDLLHEDLLARGTLISAGQLNNILIENKDAYRAEVQELLPVGVKAENQIQVDDTGGRHKGKNQYTTVIGNRWFSVFTTTESKSRVNFLKLLQGNKEEYVINEDTVEYLQRLEASDYLPGYVTLSFGEEFTTSTDWELFLQERNITKEAEVRFVTEAALYASVIRNGIPRDMEVHSDDAGQFDLFFHSLCWIHEERHYRKLIMTTDEARSDLEHVRDQIWTIYRGLKAYKENPNELSIEILEKQFDEIFQQKTSSPTLNHQLQKTYAKKGDLLKVLQRPTVFLHNNGSESDARGSKIKLKISGGTRSDVGKDARDTFLSLKQTCLKLGINFITFLQDRVRGLYAIPRLAEIIRQRSESAQAPPEYNDGCPQVIATKSIAA